MCQCSSCEVHQTGSPRSCAQRSCGLWTFMGAVSLLLGTLTMAEVRTGFMVPFYDRDSHPLWALWNEVAMMSQDTTIISQIIITSSHYWWRSLLKKNGSLGIKEELYPNGQDQIFELGNAAHWFKLCSVLTISPMLRIWGEFRGSTGFIQVICSEIVFTVNKCQTELCLWVVNFWFNSFLSITTLGGQFILMFSFYFSM